MWQFRITKYDPNKRDSFGHYLDLDEWTEFSEVGDRVRLEEYEQVERLYIEAAYQLIAGDGIEFLNLVGLENRNAPCIYNDNDKINLENIPGVIRSLLRGEYWAKLEAKNRFIHIGYDFYMYVGINDLNESVIREIVDNGLYVEQMNSPYNLNDI